MTATELDTPRAAIVLTFEQPADQLNMNKVEHWRRKAAKVKAWRERAGWAAPPARLSSSPLPRSIVQLDLPVRTLNQRRDPSNWAPTTKAVVDGLVDAGLWPDDTGDYVVTAEPIFHAGDTTVTVTITPLEDPPMPAPKNKPRPAEPTWPGSQPPGPGQGQLHDVPLDAIHADPDNLRKDLGDLSELAASIKSVGVLEPVVVRHIAAGHYQLIAGHRRHAAARIAGLATIPTIYRDDLDEGQVQEAMIVENLLRRDLDPMEEAEGYERLVALGLDQRTIAERVGFSQSHIAKRLALRKLPVTLQALVTAKTMTLEHAATAAALPPAALEILADPVYIAARGGAIREYEIRTAESTVKLNELVAKGLKSGLPRWTDAMGWSYDHVERAEATHFLAHVNSTKLQWVRSRKTATGDKNGKTKSVDEIRNKAAIARARERREWVRPLIYSPDLEDVAIKALLMCPWLGLAIGGDDARIVLDWQYLRTTLPKDTKTAASDAWAKQRTTKAITAPGGRALFTVAVLSRIEENFTRFYSTGDSPAAALYLRTLARHGWALNDVEQKIVDQHAKDLAPDSAGIKQPPHPTLDAFQNETIDQPCATWVEPQLQPADDVPPSASCSSCSRPSTGIDPNTGEPICDACWETSERAAGETEPTPTPAPPKPPPKQSLAERAAAQQAEVQARAQRTLADRLATLPPAQIDWMDQHPEKIYEEPFARFERTAVKDIVTAIDVDLEYTVRHILAFEIHRDQAMRQPVVDAALERLADIDAEPTESDIRQQLVNARKPMFDDEGEPVIADTADMIAAAEAAGKVPPERPWIMYRTAGYNAAITAIATVDDTERLEAALMYELFYEGIGSPLPGTVAVQEAILGRIEWLAVA